MKPSAVDEARDTVLLGVSRLLSDPESTPRILRLDVMRFFGLQTRLTLN